MRCRNFYIVSLWLWSVTETGEKGISSTCQEFNMQNCPVERNTLKTILSYLMLLPQAKGPDPRRSYRKLNSPQFSIQIQVFPYLNVNWNLNPQLLWYLTSISSETTL